MKKNRFARLIKIGGIFLGFFNFLIFQEIILKIIS